jgi:nucleoside-diphosphate-sugar epimerase
MAAHRFIEALLDHRPVPVHGDGRQARDFTYVGDVVAATSAALEASVPAGSVLNVANGEPAEVREVIGILAEELGVAPTIDRRPEREGDAPRTDGCADAARRVLGWEPVTDLRTGLRRQVEWHLSRRTAHGPTTLDAVDGRLYATAGARPPDRTAAVAPSADELREGVA